MMTGIGVQHRSEGVFTLDRNDRSRWAGIRIRPEREADVVVDHERTLASYQRVESIGQFIVVPLGGIRREVLDELPLIAVRVVEVRATTVWM